MNRKIFQQVVSIFFIVAMMLASTKEETERITQKFADEDKIFLSNQKVEEAIKLWKRDDRNGAIKLYNEAIELNPNNEWAYSRRGAAYFDGLKQYDAAIWDYNKALELNTNFIDAYKNRADVYSDLNQFKLATQDYEKASRLRQR